MKYVPAHWESPSYWTTELVLDDVTDEVLGLNVAISSAFYAQDAEKRLAMIDNLRQAIDQFLDTVQRTP